MRRSAVAVRCYSGAHLLRDAFLATRGSRLCGAPL